MEPHFVHSHRSSAYSAALHIPSYAELRIGGDPTPSREDIEMTQVVIEAGNVLGVPLLDHVIIGAHGGGWASLFDPGIVKGIANEKGNPLQAISA